MLTAMGDVLRKCYERGFITVRDGNISLHRKDQDFMYITPSGWRKTIIHPEHIVKVNNIYKAKTMKGLKFDKDAKPSGELEMHWRLQRVDNKTRAIVHVHATHIVAAIHAGYNLQNIAKDFPEISRYTRVGPTVGFLPATSPQLARSTFSAMTDDSGNIIYDIVGQSNHGVCSVAQDPWSAYEHIERLDHVCQMVLLSK